MEVTPVTGRWKLIYASVLAEDAQEATPRKQNVMVDGAT